MQLRLRAPTPEFADLEPNRGPVAERPPDDHEITGGKGSVFYRTHSYHTKAPPEGISPLIEHYTDRGGIVLDPFCGSGMTGLACLLTGRRGVLSDLSPAAVHIARNYTRQVSPDQFREAGQRLLSNRLDLENELYAIPCPGCRASARAEYFVWSDVHECPSCGTEMLFWECAVEDDGSIRRSIPCPGCRSTSRKRELKWLRTEPVKASISCSNCGDRSERELAGAERDAILARSRTDIPWWFPEDQFASWREMWRGQHRDQGIATAADFYTVRNLWGLAGLWHALHQEPREDIQDALRFAFTSIVNRASRRYQWNPKRPTNVLSSTLYVASLSYEFNVFSLLRRKLRTIEKLYETTWPLERCIDVVEAPAQSLAHIPDESIDYVFTDPPFGSNIFYSDASFLWESWLGDQTDQALETVVNRSVDEQHGGKDVDDYEKLMAGAFSEIGRVLRPNAWASIMFHNSDDEVWSALQRALDQSGFEIGGAVAFDKSQPSFKGVKGKLEGERVASFDLVLHVRMSGCAGAPREIESSADSMDPLQSETLGRIRATLVEHLKTDPSRKKRSTPYLHSLAMRALLLEDLPLTGWSYERVESVCAETFDRDDGGWYLREDS